RVDGRGGAEPAGRAGRRRIGFGLDLQHAVLPGRRGPGDGPAGRLAAHGRDRRRPPGRAGQAAPAARPGEFHPDTLTAGRKGWVLRVSQARAPYVTTVAKL